MHYILSKKFYLNEDAVAGTSSYTLYSYWYYIFAKFIELKQRLQSL